MADQVDSATRSRIMRQVRSKNTKPEIKVRKLLHSAGFRFSLHRKDLPGNPDIVLPKHRVVVFVHGCFWHWHGCTRSRMPKTNVAYWESKIKRNRKRDRAAKRELKDLGWTTWTVWECVLEKSVYALIGRLRSKSSNS